MARVIAAAAAALLAAVTGASPTPAVVVAHLVTPAFGFVVTDGLSVWAGGQWHRRSFPHADGTLEDAFFRDEGHGWLAFNDCAAGHAAV